MLGISLLDYKLQDNLVCIVETITHSRIEGEGKGEIDEIIRGIVRCITGLAY